MIELFIVINYENIFKRYEIGIYFRFRFLTKQSKIVHEVHHENFTGGDYAWKEYHIPRTGEIKWREQFDIAPDGKWSEN